MGGVVGLMGQMCTDTLLRDKLSEKGVLILAVSLFSRLTFAQDWYGTRLVSLQ